MARIARSTTKRDQASSPPSGSSSRPSQSPVRRRTTRSQSIELGESNMAVSRNRRTHPPKRGSRQSSVESIDSDASATSKGPRKKASRAAVVVPDLSMVAEDQELDELDEADNDDEIELTSDRQLQMEEEMARDPKQNPQSPGGMSATTAFSGTTAMTSETAREISLLDNAMIVEVLPELLESAQQVLDLLAPPNVTKELVQSICKDLLVPGSSKGRKLKHKEKKFETAAEQYVSEIQATEFPFLKPSTVIASLFGNDNPGFDNFRPDVVIYAANLSFLIKGIFVFKKDSDNAHRDLQFVESVFPTAFLSEFDDDSQFGTSALSEESFHLGLELRTQITVAILKHWREAQDFDPAQLLQEIFLESPFLHVKSIAGLSGTVYNELITSRYEAIEAAFNQSEEAVSDRDLVDFDQLETAFPWSGFLTVVAKWTRKRFDEISNNVLEQGGIQNITKSLATVVKEIDSQLDLSYHSPTPLMAPPPAKKDVVNLLPAAKIAPKSSGRSISAANAVAVLKRKYKELGENPPIPSSLLSNLRTPSHRQPIVSERATEPARITEKMRQQAFDDLGPSEEEVEDDLVEENGLEQSPILGESTPSRNRSHVAKSPLAKTGQDQPRDDNDYLITNYEEEDDVPDRSQALLDGWNQVNRDKNKENRPEPSTKRWIDKQANATKIAFDTDDEDESRSPVINKVERLEREASTESEDEGFEQDRRPVDPSRRAAARVPHRISPPKSSSHRTLKRTRQPDDDPFDAGARQSTQRERKRARTGTVDSEVEDAVPSATNRRQRQVREEQSRNLPPSTFSSVVATARAESAKATVASHATHRIRTPWSERDSELLIQYIGKYGSKWSEITKIADFECARSQVDVKDKARNIKAAYMKSGITKHNLPTNFEFVRLDKKAMDAIQKVLGNVDQNGYELD